MKTIRPIFLSTYPPEQCGLATFTKDSADAVDRASGRPISSVIAIKKTHSLKHAEGRVAHVIENNQLGAYRRAASVVNDGPWNVVNLEHEFGLYPGLWGGGIMEFVRHCEVPIVSTLHTLPMLPDYEPFRLIRQIAAHSKAVVVMTETAAELLENLYGVPRESVQVIPHGVPPVPFDRDRSQRAKLGLSGRKAICTFGLINPGKGIESMIRAMPRIVASCPEAIYCIVGVTHPLVKKQTGEAYRERLIELAATLGVSGHVQFINEYLTLPDLISYLQSCDVFVTPYPGEDQIASGTMAYAMGCVGAVVSTPYLYAKEVLADGRGSLVPFSSDRDPNEGALADAVLQYLDDPNLLAETKGRAYRYAESMFWPRVGRRYLDLYSQVAGKQSPVRETKSPSTTSTVRQASSKQLAGNL
ncbi:GDP-mannose-dependent alpha-(1-6)-phosphatidylinositol monomannoside mannosyltransferase [Stieleria bergensis]|uniref:GDP-mannose-dependent alpha-(1-6)-phosphatidylinositol monomannoside mannosyltransferase n=1 Tax=Stieleria bergensis TaxID=2528025 RepID=A0A517SWJ2_9BACT|nr:GDP-mannose-dependent alpha-(1-6)-phosphatidylinositol monomannoside mannosyltransferase [Planctomycetes bacterium SV_7m_r]